MQIQLLNRNAAATHYRNSVRLRGLAAALLLIAVSTFGCRAVDDRRTFGYLNTQGFGKQYVGDANNENYIIPTDVIAVKDTLNTDLVLPPLEVDVDGTIALPEIGQVRVAGMTREGLKAYLTEAYNGIYPKTDIQVSILPAASAHGGKKYFIVGEVTKPGAQNFRGDFTVFEALLEAEWKEENPNLSRVQLIRGDPVDPLIITINFHDFIDYGDTTYNVLVRENDIIYVPPSFIGSVGNFVKQIFYPIKVVVQPLQQLLFFFAIQNRGGGGGKVF
ncbi:MAG: polysaccharide biosynthesis/export family protein [Planctomycetes bacterium]|nr:polysaccharide biosynthesis/export family protein [Planctomycetota bacterium]